MQSPQPESNPIPASDPRLLKLRIHAMLDAKNFEFWQAEYKGKKSGAALPKIIRDLNNLWQKRSDPSWPDVYARIQYFIIKELPKARHADDPRPSETGYKLRAC